ncbi:MAG: hypothetical protein R3F39_17350 [Myxococcota bacterium]
MNRHLIILPVLLAFALTSACLADRADSCNIDSDCSQGFACSPDKVCVDFAGLLESFTLKKPPKPVKDAVTTADAVPDSATDSGDSGPTCKVPRGIFEPGAAPCGEPDEKLTVTSVCIAPSGHGTEGLAAVGNPILAGQFFDGTFTLEAWIDGELGNGCNPTIRWIRAPTDRLADCTIVHGDTMPIEVIGVIELFVQEPKFNPATGVMTGLVDEDAILAAINPAIKDIADNFIEKDVDTNNDGVDDKASVIVTIQFGPGEPTECPTE